MGIYDRDGSDKAKKEKMMFSMLTTVSLWKTILKYYKQP